LICQKGIDDISQHYLSKHGIMAVRRVKESDMTKLAKATGGIVIDGKLHPGRTNIGGEWGHHTLHRNGNSCYCGKTGCVETYISGPALEKHWTRLTGKSQTLPEILLNIKAS